MSQGTQTHHHGAARGTGSRSWGREDVSTFCKGPESCCYLRAISEGWHLELFWCPVMLKGCSGNYYLSIFPAGLIRWVKEWEEWKSTQKQVPICLYVMLYKWSVHGRKVSPSSLKQGNNPWPKGDLKAESLLFIERQWRQLNFHYFMSFIILQTFSWDLQTSQRRELVSRHLRDKSVVASLLFLWQLSSDFWSSRLVSISYLFRAFLFSKFLCSHPLRDKRRQKRPIPQIVQLQYLTTLSWIIGY